MQKKSSDLIEIQFKTLMNNIPYMTWFKDENSNYIMVNEEFETHSGKTIDEIYGANDEFVWEGMIGEKCREYDLRVMNQDQQVVFDETIPGKKGYKEFNIYKAPVKDFEGKIIGTVGIAKDITELKNKESEMSIMMENLPFAIWLKNKEGKLLKTNSKFLEFFKVNSEDVIGKKINEVIDSRFEKNMAEEDEEVYLSEKRKRFERKIEIDGIIKTFEIFKTPVKNTEGKIVGIVGSFREITKEIEYQEKIIAQAYEDSLTGLKNRRALNEHLKNLSGGEKKIVAMMLDLDNFKKINDNFGNHIGDKAICEVAKKLKEIVKDNFVARINGDEFMMIFENIQSKEELKILVDKINEELKIEFNFEDKYFTVTSSMGIIYENISEDIEKILKKSAFALYRAKELGKNISVIYDDKLEKERILNLDIEKDLKRAIKIEEIELFYQPQYDKEGHIYGFEALFRWQNEKYSKIPVIEIIKMIEKQNLIYLVGDYTMRKAFNFIKNVNEKYKKEYIVSVNLSGLQIMANDFVEKIKEMIQETGAKPSYLALEITETILMKDLDKNIEKLKELINLGIKISLDDFGTGYSSFNYLVRLPLSEIKIDRSFVSKMLIGNEYEKLVKLMIDSSHSLKLPVVVEGVETKNELILLQKMDADYYQGYYFSKPLSKENIIELIEKEIKS
ncbi:MAG: sensor domain-containing protein [Fusobacteriaceae bacterium]